MDIPDWLDKILSEPVAVATLVLALVTLVLATGAFLAIWQDHLLQKRERRERLLNEIIEWAEEINNASLTPDISLELKHLEARELNVLMRYGSSFSRAISIETITSESFKEELLENVQEVINTLSRFMCIKQLKVQGIMPSKEGFPETVIQEIEKEINSGKPIKDLFSEYATKLSRSVGKLLIKANKLKAIA